MTLAPVISWSTRFWIASAPVPAFSQCPSALSHGSFHTHAAPKHVDASSRPPPYDKVASDCLHISGPELADEWPQTLHLSGFLHVCSQSASLRGSRFM